jgi:type II secretory pathway pseudopilin PulG
LLVVIVILRIITAIAIPMVMSNQTKANANEQSRSVLQDAVNRFMTLNDGAIPEEDADTNDLTGNAKGGPYIKTIPNCDASGTETPLAINTTTGDVTIPEGCEKPTP